MRHRRCKAMGTKFGTIEDETSIARLIIHFRTSERYRKITRHSQAWIVHGHVEFKDTVIHVIVERVEDLSTRLSSLTLKSRDFR
jgi:error-prone DNA polymerase